MKIIIRTDASQRIGSGHVMRCLTLADELKNHGNEVLFISRPLPGNMINLVEARGYGVITLSSVDEIQYLYNDMNTHESWLGVPWEQDAKEVQSVLHELGTVDWLIVDHYALDARWEQAVGLIVGRVMVIDDLADRPHVCDTLLDQNYYTQMDKRYQQLVPAGCSQFLGPQFALLRPEFTKIKQELRIRDGKIENILVFYGGIDHTNETTKVLRALESLNISAINVDVIVGISNPYKNEVMELCSNNHNFHFHCQVTNMAEFMNKADLAFGAGGATTWERCFLGLPTVTTEIARNQSEVTRNVAKFGAVWNLGWYDQIGIEDIVRAHSKLDANRQLLKRLEERCLALMGDFGLGQETLVDHILSRGLRKG